MPKPNMIGKLLMAIRNERWIKSESIVKDLWDRNNLANPTKREGYKIVKDVRTGSNGSESTVWQLWKLVDQSQLTMEPTVQSKIINGIPKKESGDGNTSGTPKNNSTNSPI